MREARVQTALENSGLEFHISRITVNLALANVKKEGTGFDLAIAVSLMATDGVIATERLKEMPVLGELLLVVK